MAADTAGVPRLAKLSAGYVKNYSEGSGFSSSGRDFEVTCGSNMGGTGVFNGVLDV